MTRQGVPLFLLASYIPYCILMKLTTQKHREQTSKRKIKCPTKSASSVVPPHTWQQRLTRKPRVASILPPLRYQKRPSREPGIPFLQEGNRPCPCVVVESLDTYLYPSPPFTSCCRDVRRGRMGS